MTEALFRRIEENSNTVAASRREIVDVGPFRALLDMTIELVWVNYAVPVAPLEDMAAAEAVLTELRQVFRERRRTPRFVFTEGLWPGLPALLEAAGLREESRNPLMVCTPAEFRPFQAPAVSVRPVTAEDTEDALRAVHRVQRDGFGVSPEPLSAEEVVAVREALATGHMRLAVGCLEGQPAGAGRSMPLNGVAELAGVATLPSMRRRGVAASVCSFLTRELFEQGGELVWLQARDAVAQAAYAKIGFRRVGTRVNYIETVEGEPRTEEEG